MKRADKAIPTEFYTLQAAIFDVLKLPCSSLLADEESSDYEACSFQLDELSVRFRVAKVTPTKIGQFVTFWKRLPGHAIQPYDLSDAIDLYPFW